MGIVRDHVFERFSRWSRSSNENKSAGELSKILVMFESFTGGRNKDAQNVLDAIHYSLKNRRSSGHRFSELLRSQRLLGIPEPELAAYHKMRHLQAHRADLPVDSMRDIVAAISMSLIHLGRLNVHELSHADVVKMSSSKSSVLLPAAVARKLDNLKPSNRDLTFESNMLLLALENLAAGLEQPRVVEFLASSTVATLWQMVSAISLNYVLSYAPDFPDSTTPSPSSRSQLKRWSQISLEAWGKINACLDHIFSALQFEGKSKIKPQKVPAAGIAWTQDPMEFLQWCDDVSAPLVVWKSVSSSVDLVDDKTKVLTWWRSGLEVLQSLAPAVSVSNSPNAGLGGTTQSLNASAAPFIPLVYEQSLIDLEALERQTDLKNAALFAIAGFLKRRLQQDAYLEERKMCNQLHMTRPGDVHTEAMSILSDDIFQRSARYKGLRETGPPRTTWNWDRKYFDEVTLGSVQYDFVKDR
jgi:hypothetical protein